jgi:hypothetical protein
MRICAPGCAGVACCLGFGCDVSTQGKAVLVEIGEMVRIACRSCCANPRFAKILRVVDLRR